MRGTRALCGERRRQVEDDAAGIPLVVVERRGNVEFDFGRMVVAAAGCAHLTAGRSRKVRHMEAMAAARMLRAGLHCHALARQRRQSRPRRRKKIDGEQQQRYGPFQFHLLFHDSAFGEARDPPPGILPGRVGVDLVTFGEQQRGIRSRKLASPQLLPQIHRRRIERHDACHIAR